MTTDHTPVADQTHGADLAQVAIPPSGVIGPDRDPVPARALTTAQRAALADIDEWSVAAAPAHVGRTDDANALRLVDENGATIRRVADMAAWWSWTGTAWTRDHDSAHVRESARNVADVLGSGG